MVPMRELVAIREKILANGKVDGVELEELRGVLEADGKIDRNEADVLVEIHKRVRNHNPGFEHFFYQMIKRHLLADGKIAAAEVPWIEQMLGSDGRLEDEERRFLCELKGEAQEVCPEFEKLFHRCMKLPMERRTAG